MKTLILTWIFSLLILEPPVDARTLEEFKRLIQMDKAGWHESPKNWSFTAFIDDRGTGGRMVCPIQNISKEDRMLVIGPVMFRYEFLWEGGAPESKSKRRTRAPSDARMRRLELLKPGDRLSEPFLLQEYFNFIKGQRYALRLKQWLEEYPMTGKERVGIVSNRVEFVAR